MQKKLHAGIIVSYKKEDPTTAFYISFLDAEAKTASIISVKTPVVIHHNIPWRTADPR